MARGRSINIVQESRLRGVAHVGLAVRRRLSAGDEKTVLHHEVGVASHVIVGVCTRFVSMLSPTPQKKCDLPIHGMTLSRKSLMSSSVPSVEPNSETKTGRPPETVVALVTCSWK